MYIGLDIGTSGTKAALYDADGVQKAAWQQSYGFSNTDQGFRELDAVAVWKAVVCCLQKAAAGQRVKSITVSSLGEAVIPINQNGEPLYFGITGTDARGEKQLDILQNLIGKERLVEITGVNLSSIYSANKILWIKDNWSELYERTWKFVTFQDFVIYRLTGESRIDYSMASRTLLFDIDTKEWSSKILEKTGISKDKLSVPILAGMEAGVVRTGLAGELGLPDNVKVIAGTHDHICNAIGSGAVEYGNCANTVGTTEGVTALLKKSQMSAENIEKYQISCEPFVKPDMYNTVAWNNTSGVLLRWFAEELSGWDKKTQIQTMYQMWNRKMPSEPTKLLVLPHFSGAATPHMDKHSKGAVIGLTLGTRAEDIYKALMEGANYELLLILNCVKKAGLEVSKLIATGGALSAELLQIKADILGIPIHTVENRQTGTLGGAILGAVADGAYSNMKEATEGMIREAETYLPNAARAEFYRERAACYQDLYAALADIHHQLV